METIHNNNKIHYTHIIIHRKKQKNRLHVFFTRLAKSILANDAKKKKHRIPNIWNCSFETQNKKETNNNTTNKQIVL